MFPLREIPSLDEIRERGKKFGLLNPGAILAALRTLRVANDLMAVVEANFARLGTSAGRFSVLMLLHRTEGESLAPSELAQHCAMRSKSRTAVRSKSSSKISARFDTILADCTTGPELQWT